MTEENKVEETNHAFLDRLADKLIAYGEAEDSDDVKLLRESAEMCRMIEKSMRSMEDMFSSDLGGIAKKSSGKLH